MKMPNSVELVFELAEQHIAGTASAEQIAELEALLSNQPELRRVYLRYLLVHGQLALTSEGLPAFTPATSFPTLSPVSLDTPFASPMYNVWLAMTAIAATIFLGISASLFLAGPDRQNSSDSSDGLQLSTDDTAGLVDEGHYDNLNLPIHTVGVLDTNKQNILPTTFNIQQGSTRLTTNDGTDVQIDGPAIFGASTGSEGVLFEGSVHASATRRETSYSIQTASLRMVDRSTGFRVATVDQDRIRVDVLDGEVEVQSRVRMPLYYWSFDSFPNAEASTDSHEASLVSLGASVKLETGLIGAGALAFDNNKDSYAHINEGTGPEIGTGTMACSSGISIEALIISRWSGKPMDYDEIFRKEDGNHRILFSFQNDGSMNHFANPKVAPGPCLSFGLHLEQQGYHELDMPLDGLNGRPTLSELNDGKPHHVVATYDSFTGQKAIYVDGRKSFSHAFPVGNLILSGGPMHAAIGNHRGVEPFTGVIDELAFYDFALSPNEIADHYQRVRQGMPYFEVSKNAPDKNRWQVVAVLAAGSSQLLDRLNGLRSRSHTP